MTPHPPPAPRLAKPPAIDPREHAVHARHWGMLACYLVHYEGRYSAWITGPGPGPGDSGQVCAMPSEPAGRDFVDGWQTVNMLHTPWGERIAHIFLVSPTTRNGILYQAAVVNVEDARHPHRGRPPVRHGQLPGHGRQPVYRDRPGRPPGRVGVRRSGR